MFKIALPGTFFVCKMSKKSHSRARARRPPKSTECYQQAFGGGSEASPAPGGTVVVQRPRRRQEERWRGPKGQKQDRSTGLSSGPTLKHRGQPVGQPAPHTKTTGQPAAPRRPRGRGEDRLTHGRGGSTGSGVTFAEVGQPARYIYTWSAYYLSQPQVRRLTECRHP
jgi:hypothetical protein